MKAYNEPIECIATWDIRGNITPVRFRFKDKTYGHIQIRYKTVNKHAGNPMRNFTCVASSEGKEYSCELRYELNTCLWRLYKI